MKIKIDDLFFLYSRDGYTSVALRGLDLEIESRECLVINGPNGSGKSTLVKILTGFEPISAGKVSFDEWDISKIDPVNLRREFVSSIDQKGNLLVDLTVAQNIELAFSLISDSSKSVKTQTSSLLVKYKLNDVADRYPSELSASERQLSALAVALATNPKVLIADEPSGELDDKAAATFYRTLASLSAAMTVILVTHDPRAEVIADRVVRIRNGRISQSWRPGGVETNVIDKFGWSQMNVKAGKNLPKVVKQESKIRASINPLLVVKGAALAFGAKQLFSDLTFSAAPGQLIAITGPSGSGKSSLLRILAGAQTPSKGSVKFDGQEIGQLNREQSASLRAKFIGYMAQGPDPLEKISLRDHLLFSETDSSAWLGDLSSFSYRSLSEFSGGERARIEILKLLSLEKPLLLMDEPSSQLDEIRTREMAALITTYLAEGGIVIACTREPIFLHSAHSIVKL